jgi:hypothetical protein
MGSLHIIGEDGGHSDELSRQRGRGRHEGDNGVHGWSSFA